MGLGRVGIRLCYQGFFRPRQLFQRVVAILYDAHSAAISGRTLSRQIAFGKAAGRGQVAATAAGPKALRVVARCWSNLKAAARRMLLS